MVQEDMQEDVRKLRQWIYGYQIAQAIHVVARLGIPDLLACDEALDTPELARRAGCNADALRRLMDALETLGIFRHIGDDTYTHTGLSHLLASGTQHSQDFAASIYGDEHYRAWADLHACVKTGEPAFERLYGQDYFSYLDQQARLPGKLQQYMAQDTAERARVLMDLCDFSSTRHLVDVGGDGGIVTALLQRFPAMCAILIEPARGHLEQDVGGRACHVAAGVLDALPAGADIYLLSQILHRFGDEEARDVLQGCRRAMTHGSRLLILEYPLPADDALAPGRWMDLNMMVVCGGRERSVSAYEALVRSAGLAPVARHEAAAGWQVLECLPA